MKILGTSLTLLLFVHSNDVPFADWMVSLMRPHKVPLSSCCGVADQYWVKEYTPSQTPGVAFHAVVFTKDNNGVFMMDIPDNVVIWDRVNPTGRGVVFIATGEAEQTVLCFVPGTSA